MAKGIIYILTNPSMSGYVKIGKTTNLEKRLKSLNKTNVAEPFQCIFAAEVGDYDEREKLLHDAFADTRTRKNREFFEIDAQRVISALKIAKGKDVTPGKKATKNSKSPEKASERREQFKFSMIDLKPGDEISYRKDEKVKATIIDDRKILFEGKDASISGIARILLQRDGAISNNSKGVQGAKHWKYDGELLIKRRERMEKNRK